MWGRVQTAQAVAGEAGDGTGVSGDGADEEGGAGSLGHWTAVMGKDRASVNVGQNMSEEPAADVG